MVSTCALADLQPVEITCDYLRAAKKAMTGEGWHVLNATQTTRCMHSDWIKRVPLPRKHFGRAVGVIFLQYMLMY